MSIKLRKSQSKRLETLKTARVAAFVKTFTLANVFWNTQEECFKMLVENLCFLCAVLHQI